MHVWLRSWCSGPAVRQAIFLSLHYVRVHTWGSDKKFYRCFSL